MEATQPHMIRICLSNTEMYPNTIETIEYKIESLSIGQSVIGFTNNLLLSVSGMVWQCCAPFHRDSGGGASFLPHCEYYLPSLLLEEVEGYGRNLYKFYLSLALLSPMLNTVDEKRISNSEK